MSDAISAAAQTLDLEALGVFNQDEVAASAWARILIIGPIKSGKTTAIVTTAPDPLVINCDLFDSTLFAKKQGAKFLQIPVDSLAAWKKAQLTARKCVEAGVARTVIVDTATMLSDNLIEELLMKYGDDSRGAYGELLSQIMGGIKRLCKLEAHVIVVGHIAPEWNEVEGIMPLIAGQSKTKLPALMTDWVTYDYNPEAKIQRRFLVGSQGKWTHAGRNVSRSTIVPASIPALFEELGIKL